jgi:sugar/nucleoside kinase (ribokinase family)
MTQEITTYDVAAIGNYTKDTVVTPAGTRQVDGGGVRYAAYAAAGLGCRVAAVTRLAGEDARVVADLERAGIDVFPVFTPESTLMRLEYPTTNPDERILSVAATAGSFTVDQVKPLTARSYLISASIRGEVPNDVVGELRTTGATIALDVQGFIRIRQPDGRLEHAPWPNAREVLSKVDIVKADAVEAASLTGESDARTAARILAEYGPREVVVTHRDGLLALADGEYHEARFHPKQMVGRSGRGDTCLGSYTAARLGVPPAEAIVWAAAVTSLKMESDGPFHEDISAVIDLIQQEYGLALEPPVPVTVTTGVHNTGA